MARSDVGFFTQVLYNADVSPCEARDPLDGFEPTQITRGQTPCGFERFAAFEKHGTLCSHLLRQVQKLRQGTTLWGDLGLPFCVKRHEN